MNRNKHLFRSRLVSFIPFILLGVAIAACSSAPRVEFEPTQTRSVSPTHQPRPTITPTPTATAHAIVVRDDRPRIPQTPNPLGLATRCGVAEFFDYPLDAPDAEAVTGGQDFGKFRDRYEGYHTGEDWWYERRGSLGKPIYNIGDGRVRYVAPFGWGDDLGTLVIEHILPNGRHLYSFYGHVDPDSLTLRAGQCVEKGQKIGEIGDPRSSPHLHFEIRTIFADGPGPGYWSIDPAISGWLPPSETVEFSRYAADERVRWWRAIKASRLQSQGWLEQSLVLQQEGTALVSVDIETGEVLLQQPIDGTGVVVAGQPNRTLLYVADGSETIHAYAFGDLDQVDEPLTAGEQALWSAPFGGSGPIQIIPLTDGVVVIRRHLWSAFSAKGEPLWQVDPGSRMTDWIVLEGGVLAATSGEQEDLWTITEKGALAWDANRSGKLFGNDNQAYLYSDGQLHQLSLVSRDLTPIYTWSRAQLSMADLIAVEGDGLIVLHKDVFDQRLLRIDNDGELVWEQSIQVLEPDRAQLIRCGGKTLMLTEHDRLSSVKVDLFRLNPNGKAEHIFQTIVRERFTSESGATCVADDAVLLSLGGQRLIRFDLIQE